MNDLKIGIIGGKGAMGRWFQTYFKQDGYPVFISDLDTRLSNAELAVRCDMVILSIPVQTAVSVADEIGPLMKKHQLLLDICSLKEKIVEAMFGRQKPKSSVLIPCLALLPMTFMDKMSYSVRPAAISGNTGWKKCSKPVAQISVICSPLFTINTWQLLRGLPIF
jgi:hypothetical protein